MAQSVFTEQPVSEAGSSSWSREEVGVFGRAKRRSSNGWAFSCQQVCSRSDPKSTWKHSPVENTVVSTSS